MEVLVNWWKLSTVQPLKFCNRLSVSTQTLLGVSNAQTCLMNLAPNYIFILWRNINDIFDNTFNNTNCHQRHLRNKTIIADIYNYISCIYPRPLPCTLEIRWNWSNIWLFYGIVLTENYRWIHPWYWLPSQSYHDIILSLNHNCFKKNADTSGDSS